MRKRYAVKLGYAPTRRNVFSREDSLKYKKRIKKQLEDWGIDLVDLEGINKEGLLYGPEDVPKAVERFRKEGVEAVFAPHCNFGTEDAVAKLAKAMGKPFLLWGPRDEAPLADGTRLRDTQCGLFATSKVLRRFGAPFTYITNSRVDDPIFERGVKNFMAAAAVVREFRTMRIGQISTRPDAFWTVKCNEGELLERFGIEVVSWSLVDLVASTTAKIKKKDKKLVATIQDIKKRINVKSISAPELAKMAAMKLAMQEFVDAEGLSGLAVQCWTAMQESLGVMPCFTHSELTGEGVPVACETDIHGAVSAVMLQAARLGETPTFFADLTIRHPENENSELLWHCGPFPSKLAAEDVDPAIGRHYILDPPYPGVCDWRIKGGDVTIARFDGDFGEYRLLMGHAMSCAGPFNRGTYLWVEVGNWPLWEEKIIRGPYIHHVANIHGEVAPVLYEACRYIPGLTPDPVEPTEAEIQAWLRNQD
ncbi:MAG: fucose isomerase [Planctomycetes bacterium]|nr:fucose isomerase [Planctomycetota bacterium]